MTHTVTGSSVFSRPLITMKQVAEALGVTPQWAYKHRVALERHGFPKPVVYKLYDSLAVRAWLDAQMDPKLRKVLEQTGAA